MAQVTDPALLEQLNGAQPSAGAQVTDPAAIELLNKPSWGDLGRFAMTATTRGMGSLIDSVPDPLSVLRRIISPSAEQIEQTGRWHPGAALGGAVHSATGVPEYQPQTPQQEQALNAATGLVGGAPFGPIGMGVGVASSLASDLARQYLAPALGLSPTNTERLSTAASVVPGVAAGVIRSRERPAVPTARDLAGAPGQEGGGTAGQAFERFRNAPVEYDPLAVADTAQTVQSNMRRRGPRPEWVPETSAVLNDLANPQTPRGWRGFYSPEDLQRVREQLSDIIDTNSKSLDRGAKREVRAAMQARQELDRFIDSAGQAPNALASGTEEAATQAAADFRKGRGDWAQAQKSNEITGELARNRYGIAERAQGRADAANSGQNLDNSIRSRVESWLENRSKALGLSPDEFAALDQVVRGGAVQNFLRTWGNRLNNPLMGAAMTALGAKYFGVPGALIGQQVPIQLGGMAKSFENALASRNLDRANTAILMNSPEFQQRLAQMPPRDAAIAQTILPGLLAPPRTRLEFDDEGLLGAAARR